ncbi:transposase [Escherichia coli]|nr:transposase [Escherichia coli]
MISLPAGSRIWLVAGITDMRNGFNGLASKVQNVLKDDRSPDTCSSSADAGVTR